MARHIVSRIYLVCVVDRTVDYVLSATIGGTEQDLNFRDTSIPKLPPEQQIRQEEEVQTPPRREPRRDEGQQPRGPRAMTNETVLAPEGLTYQQTETAGRNRQTEEWSPVAALENTVSRMQRDLEDLQTENWFLRTPRPQVSVPLVRQAALTTTKVPWFNGSTSWERYQQVFDAIKWMGQCDCGTTVTVVPAGRCSERGIIDTDAPPSL